ESMKKIGVQYCYRRGERVADISHGLEVQELAMALAVSGDSMANVTVAKRNAGSLTDPSGHYSKIFDKGIEAATAWDLVKRWRLASSVIASFVSQHTGREAQLAVHGNRFIENILLATKGNINSKKMEKIHAALKQAIDKLYGADCYLAVLFKNTKKCEALRAMVMGEI
ncbi:hypothetical protein, partial [Ralstonia solanacearum]